MRMLKGQCLISLWCVVWDWRIFAFRKCVWGNAVYELPYIACGCEDILMSRSGLYMGLGMIFQIIIAAGEPAAIIYIGGIPRFEPGR